MGLYTFYFTKQLACVQCSQRKWLNINKTVGCVDRKHIQFSIICENEQKLKNRNNCTIINMKAIVRGFHCFVQQQKIVFFVFIFHFSKLEKTKEIYVSFTRNNC